MPLTQLGAVQNRRIKPRNVDIINAQTPYLPQIYRRRQDREYANKMYNLELQGLQQARELEQQRLGQNESIAQRNYELAQKAQDEQEKQAKKARRIGYADLGLRGLTGLANLYNAYNPEESVPDIATGAAQILPSALPGVLESVSTNPTEAVDIIGNVPGSDSLVDYIPDPIKNIGGAIWDYGSGLYEEATNFISGLFT